MKKGWLTKKLGDVCAFDKAQGIHHGLPYVGLEHIESHTARFIGSSEAQTVKSSTFRFSDEHILYGRLRPYLNKALVPDFEGHCSTEIFPLKPSPELSRAYLLYWLLADTTCDRINATCTGARMPRAQMNDVLGFEIPVPSLAEQQRIVGLLDEAFEGLATAKANAEKNLQNARAIFESGLASAITGKLTLEWRHKHIKTGSASADLAARLAVHRKQWTGTGKYREPDAPVTLKPIDIPDGWVLASPEQITTHIVDCPHSTPKWAESGMVCLRTTNFKPGLLDLESVRFVSPQTYKERIMRLEPQSGDVLYSREGGILGIACIIPEQLKTCLGQRMMLFRTDAGLILPEYFTAVLNSTLILSEVKRLTGGAASPHLNICDIRTFPIPLPPITEQRQIVAKLNTIAAETQRLARIYERKLAALAELKKSLLHQAFTGEL